MLMSREAILRLKEALDKYVYGREEMKLMILACLVSGCDGLIISPPGEAKTFAITILSQLIEGCRLFRKVLFYDLSRFDILGMPKIVEEYLENRREMSIIPDIESGIATANIALFDEVFKAPGPIAVLIYDILAHRTIEWQGKSIRLDKLWVVYGLSNIDDINEKRNEKDPTFQPLYDRFSVKLWLSRMSLDECFQVIKLTYEQSGDFRVKNVTPVVSVQDIEHARKEVENYVRTYWKEIALTVTGVVRVVNMYEKVDVSPRKIVQLVKYVGALMWMGVPTATILFLLANCLADEIEKVQTYYSHVVTISDLKQQEELYYLIKTLDKCIVNGDTKQAKALLEELNRKIRELPLPLKKTYEEILAKYRQAIST